MTTTKDKSALMLIGFIGFFIVASMILLIIFAFNGTGDGTGENVWSGLFSLTTAILGAVGGYLGGTTMEARKQQEQLAAQAAQDATYAPRHSGEYSGLDRADGLETRRPDETGAVDTSVIILIAAVLFIICAIVWLVQAF